MVIGGSVALLKCGKGDKSKPFLDIQATTNSCFIPSIHLATHGLNSFYVSC